MKNFLAALVVVSLWPAIAVAQTPAWNTIGGELKIALETRGDPVRGEAAFEPCQGCHRKDASGRTSGAYPRLSGQHATVLMKQIADMRAGIRNNPKMDPFIDDHVLTPYEIADVATYVHGLPIANTNGKGLGTAIDKGRQLYDKDCAVCHGSQGEGSAAKFYPMLAAQHFRYLVREGKYIRDGDRRNSNPEMVKVIKTYADEDIEAVADYLSLLPPPQK